MLAVSCEKCRRRFTLTPLEVETYVKELEEKKFAQVVCPHCGKGNKVAGQRLQAALRTAPGSPPAE